MLVVLFLFGCRRWHGYFSLFFSLFLSLCWFNAGSHGNRQRERTIRWSFQDGQAESNKAKEKHEFDADSWPQVLLILGIFFCILWLYLLEITANQVRRTKKMEEALEYVSNFELERPKEVSNYSTP